MKPGDQGRRCEGSGKTVVGNGRRGVVQGRQNM